MWSASTVKSKLHPLADTHMPTGYPHGQHNRYAYNNYLDSVSFFPAGLKAREKLESEQRLLHRGTAVQPTTPSAVKIMYSAVSSATGCALLLLSSVITLLILLRLRCKRQTRTSPFYVLSTSDVLSAALTATMLLVNHVSAGIKINNNRQANVDDRMPVRNSWTAGDQSSRQRLPPFLQIADDLPEYPALSADLNVTLTCDMKDILMQYGTLLAALTNAFVSLLTFAVQCSLSAACIKRRYASATTASSTSDARPASKDTQVTSGWTEVGARQSAPRNSAAERGEGGTVANRLVRKIVKISRFRALKEDDGGPAGYLVAAHWLVPLLVVGILYLAEYDDMNTAQGIGDTECILQTNFPIDDLYGVSGVDDGLRTFYSTAEHGTLGNNYLLGEGSSNSSKPGDVEVDQIVSRVQEIVRSVLNYTRDSAGSAGSTDSHGSPGSRDTNSTGIVYGENGTDINTVIRILYGTSMERTTAPADDEEDEDDDDDDGDDDDNDVSTSGSLSNVSQTSAGSKNDSEEEAALETTRFTPGNPEENATLVSTNQIYADIMKRIQAAAKNPYDPRDNGTKRNASGGYAAKRKPYPTRHLSAGETERFDQYVNLMGQHDRLVDPTRRTVNRCLLSMRFLRSHLLALSFAVYFLPVLLASILQTRGRHACRKARAMLRASVDQASTSPRDSSRNARTNKADNVNEPPTEFFFSTNEEEIRRERCKREPDVSRECGSHSRHSDAMGMETMDDRHDEDHSQDTLEIDCMVRILGALRLSLILCVLLWTPMLLGTLLRAFSCIEASRWWNNVTFLSAIAFGIVRNALNVSVIRIREACGKEAGVKENRVHPTE